MDRLTNFQMFACNGNDSNTEKMDTHKLSENQLEARITVCKKNILQGTKRIVFCIKLLLAMKNGFITTTPNVNQRILITFTAKTNEFMLLNITKMVTTDH